LQITAKDYKILQIWAHQGQQYVVLQKRPWQWKPWKNILMALRPIGISTRATGLVALVRFKPELVLQPNGIEQNTGVLKVCSLIRPAVLIIVRKQRLFAMQSFPSSGRHRQSCAFDVMTCGSCKTYKVRSVGGNIMTGVPKRSR
jgi:hypothetical protein